MRQIMRGAAVFSILISETLSVLFAKTLSRSRATRWRGQKNS
jgi:post-segregation antitoxin (ccd killing protein)